jgi:hypothetical protein
VPVLGDMITIDSTRLYALLFCLICTSRCSGVFCFPDSAGFYVIFALLLLVRT